MIGGSDMEKDRRLGGAPAPVAMTARCRHRWQWQIGKVGGQRRRRADES